jgi:hypothetical protein
MKKNLAMIAVIMIAMHLGSFSGFAQEAQKKETPPPSGATTEQELALESEDANVQDMADEQGVEEFMATKEVEGKVTEVTTDSLTVKKEDGKALTLYIDADTLIYINDEKGKFSDVKQNDSIFAYYVEENGTMNCDWLEVSRYPD